jgi:hypothetical protein
VAGEVGRQDRGDRPALEGLHGRPGAVERQVDGRGGAGKALPPVGELSFEGGPAQSPALPMSGVRDLNWQLGQLRGACVERRQLADQDAHRPSVGDDVVQGEEQGMLFHPEPQQDGPQQRPALEVERPGGDFGGPALGLLTPGVDRVGAGLLGQPREIDQGEEERRGWIDELHGRAGAQGEAGAQRLVPAADLREAALQPGRIERAAETRPGRQVVGAGAGGQAVEEPEPLLRERERQAGRVARHGDQRDVFDRGTQGLGTAYGEPGDGGVLEDGAQGQLDAERGPQA